MEIGDGERYVVRDGRARDTTRTEPESRDGGVTRGEIECECGCLSVSECQM